MERAFNKHTIEKIVLKDFTETTWYTYKKEIKIFGFIIQESGFYNCLGHFIGKTVDSCVAINNKAHFKPQVIIRFVSGKEQEYFFETYHEAEIFFNDLLGKDSFIEY